MGDKDVQITTGVSIMFISACVKDDAQWLDIDLLHETGGVGFLPLPADDLEWDKAAQLRQWMRYGTVLELHYSPDDETASLVDPDSSPGFYGNDVPSEYRDILPDWLASAVTKQPVYDRHQALKEFSS